MNSGNWAGGCGWCPMDRHLTKGSCAPCNTFARGSYPGPLRRTRHLSMSGRCGSTTDVRSGERSFAVFQDSKEMLGKTGIPHRKFDHRNQSFVESVRTNLVQL